MKRRNIVQSLAAASLGWFWPALALPQRTNVNIIPESLPEGFRPLKARVIGVGHAGSQLLLETWRSRPLAPLDGSLSYAVVTGRDITGSLMKAQCNPLLGLAPVQIVPIGHPMTSSREEHARWAVETHGAVLQSLVEDVDIVCLVAGVGGATGSAVAPVLAQMAQSVGTRVLVVIATPFQWEKGRYPHAFKAVRDLELHSDCMASLSNDMRAQVLGRSASLKDVLALQATEIADTVRRLLVVATYTRMDAEPVWGPMRLQDGINAAAASSVLSF